MSHDDLTTEQTWARLGKLDRATLTHTSHHGCAQVSKTGTQYLVRLRANGFQTIDPDVLATEVVDAFIGVQRGYRQAEQQVLSTQRSPTDIDFADTDLRTRVMEEREKITVTVTSPKRIVRGSWKGIDTIQLHIKPVNASYRPLLETELSTVVTEMSQSYADEVHRILRAVSLQHGAR